ncbi:MAG: phosphopantothenate--cysteine ligase [Eubacteriaceae bacterium]|nr:phosphopantothenate--cysteine ligase [Eubacteriaceae bacterium]
MGESANILITSGGTSEPIDNVRVITNLGTGRLGSLIADRFAQQEKVGKIFYVCGDNSKVPQNSKKVTVIRTRSVRDLKKELTRLMEENRIDAVIHSMAVSDYTVNSVTTIGALAEYLDKNSERKLSEALIQRGISSTDVRGEAGKISSKLPSPIILLGPTPKIIALLRGMAPESVIVGFKLLDHVTSEELVSTARDLMEKNDCDMVLANDSARISGDRHTGYLVDRDGSINTYNTKQDIAEGIASEVMQKLEEKWAKTS